MPSAVPALSQLLGGGHYTPSAGPRLHTDGPIHEVKGSLLSVVFGLGPP